MAKRPHNEHELELALTRLSGSNVKAVECRNLMAAAVLGQMLPEGCVVKGGTSMRFRLGPTLSRITVDFDAARRMELDAFLKALKSSLSVGWCDFTGEVVVLRQSSPKGVPFEYVMQPLDVKLSYRQHAWCTVRLEVTHNELGDADEIEWRDLPVETGNLFEALDFPVPSAVPLMPIPFQIAQKLHAVTQAGSMRARDLIDLQLLLANAEVDIPRTALICRRLFSYRRMQHWPPKIQMTDEWERLYSEQKLDLPVLPSASEAVHWTNELIMKIESADVNERSGSFLFALNFPGTAVITEGGRNVSYAELKSMTTAWHSEIAPRSLVFLLVGNNLESLVAYVACLNRGIVPLMLDAKIDAELLARFESAYAPNYVIDCVDGSTRSTHSTRLNLFPDLALLLTTSGSTGSPKLVRQSYANIAANTKSIVEYLKLDATERPITTLPMNYTYGLSIINSHLSVGATILLTNKTLMQREFWTFFSEQGATSFGGVPYTYEMLDKLMFFRRKLPSLRTMTQAGGKILPMLHQKFAEYAQREGKNFVVMYGQCEATARMSYLPPERALDKVGSMGIPIPGGAFSLIDVNGAAVLEPGVTGELVYDGANVTLGYAECAADLEKGDERHGRLVTGDMAQRDAEGFYYIVGRKKRFLKIFGNRVNLDETERLIKSHFSTLDCACGGVDDKMKIYVTDQTLVKPVQDFVADKTHLNFTAFQVVKIDKIPKNESGKTLYKELPE